ncbi:HlyD family secretion protein [Paraburkholderia sp.]|uniref:HlyD family secretion protein n=1 Tax=Paraburkholderia sp. TaxID=1926495 RepID=UPI00238D1DCF|nr:HlyD family secretion protein [Paraburkholderia sp.]MDE1179386.1 HlyD family secretion protein [Paraburkholderia sp.]
MSSTTLPEKTAKTPLMARKTVAIVAAVVASIAAAGFGVHWWRVGRFIESTDDAYVRADVVTVSSRVSGYVTRVSVDDNQTVRKGDVLARIDDADYRAKVAKAQASVDAAVATLHAEHAALATLDAQLAQQSNVTDGAEADIKAAEAAVARRRADAERYRQLAAEQASSTQRWEQAHADALSADAALAKAHAEVRAQRGQRAVLLGEKAQHAVAIDAARAQVGIAQAALTLAQLDLDHTVIRAATDGSVGQRAVRAGQYVETGQPLLAVVPLDAVYVIANFKETEVAAMRAGQTVEIDVDSYSGHTLPGRVAGIAPGSGAQFALLPPDNATGNFTKVVQRIPVKIAVDRGALASLQLRPGMSVIARVHTQDRDAGGNDRNAGAKAS